MTDEQLVWLTVYAAAISGSRHEGIASAIADQGVKRYKHRFNNTDPAPPPRPELPTMPEVG